MTTEPSAFNSLLERVYQRSGVNTLPAHLEKTFGITVTKMSQLDVGVFRIDRSNKEVPLVARLFSAARPYAAAEADLVVLRYLAGIGFPAERPFGDKALTSHEGQAVLMTEFVKKATPLKRPPYPIVRLGAMVGWLHGLPVPAGADRPAGALHHFAEGTMADELRAVVGWLDSIEARVPNGAHDAFDTMRTAVISADGGDGLPEAFVHPDLFRRNVILTADGPVLVDWTSAGRGPRLPSMTVVLCSRSALPFMKGYSRLVSLTDDERDRLAGLLFSRRLIHLVFRVSRRPEKLVTTAKNLSAVRRESEQKADELVGRRRRVSQVFPRTR